MSKTYEELARESLLNTNTIPFPIKKLGRWWDKNDEIDIVGIGENEIVFGECKWSVKKVGLSVLYDLKEKSKKVQWKNTNRKEYFILFSKEGFSDELIEFTKENNNIILSEF